MKTSVIEGKMKIGRRLSLHIPFVTHPLNNAYSL